MTDSRAPDADRENARRHAVAVTAAARDLEAFLRRLPDPPGPADITEYAALLTREEMLRGERQTAAGRAGLQLPSLESD